jgi:hypothetical protein
MPADQNLYLDVYGPDAVALVREDVYTHEEPDAELERHYLPTMMIEDGVQQGGEASDHDRGQEDFAR